ncbi:thiamine-phosphate kinase [Metabacillus arenae]|uniref:Thiamine-monophosphate kinase n=1 Tax=Metabacillus arenae TaxID=2771434 RepID=A0A926RZI5_9BACI|nr:thiamine-phosphate kinase [Metabacillus arenae]MBD1383161.1 thiamine-phosphate kinase [Metabacillus arenae]
MSLFDEFSFIHKIKPTKILHSELITPIGDDASVYKVLDGARQVVCVDTMVEGVHFLKEFSTPEEIGYKGLAVNISDLAAMASIPKYYLISIAIPPHWKEEEIIGIYQGMAKLAKTYMMDLIGGDTVSTGDKLVITVTVIGEIEKDHIGLRSNAMPGDVVFVTGTLGDSAAGLDLLLKKVSVRDPNISHFLINRHKYPSPRVKEGRYLSKMERVALNDISDGLASELHEIAEASQVSIKIEFRDIPKSKEILTLREDLIEKWVLFGGEDFELVGTASVDSWSFIKKIAKENDFQISKIGIVEKGPAEVWLQRDKVEQKLKKSGYNHFKQDR